MIGFVCSLKEQRVTGIFISHNMHQVFECCDRIVAMARGEIVLDRMVEYTSLAEILTVL